MLDGLMVDCVSTNLFAGTVVCVRAKASVFPHVLDGVVAHVVFKWDTFEVICRGQTNNGIVLCQSRRYWFEFVTM